MDNSEENEMQQRNQVRTVSIDLIFSPYNNFIELLAMCKIIFSDKQDKSTEVKEQSVLYDFYDGVLNKPGCVCISVFLSSIVFYSTVKTFCLEI